MIKRRNYKVIALTLTFLMLFASVASAAIPTDSVIIGDKAYSIGYVTNPANAAEIQAALDNLGTGQLAYNIDGQTSGWTSIMEGTPLTADQITALPPITYKNDAGEVSNYAAGDGDLIPSGLAVSNVVADNGNITITVTGEGTPVEGDFTFVSRIGDAAKADLAVSNFNWTEATKTVTFTFAPFAATDTAQSIEIGWQYKDSKGWAAAFTVPAAEGLEITNLSAINTTTIKVTFSGEVTAEQMAVANYTVSKGTIESVAKTGDENKAVVLTVAGLNYEDALTVTVVKPAYTKDIKVPKISDLYELKIICDAPGNTIKSDGASMTMLTAQIIEKANNEPVKRDAQIQFSATLGSLSQPQVALQDGKASTQLRSIASPTSVTSVITGVVASAPGAEAFVGLNGQLIVNFTPEGVDPGSTTMVSAVSAGADQGDRFFVKFSGKIDATAYKAVVTSPTWIAAGKSIYGIKYVDGTNTKQVIAIKDVYNLTDDTLMFVLDTDSPGSVQPTSNMLDAAYAGAGAPNFLRDNVNHTIVIPDNVTDLVVNSSNITFMMSDVTKPFVYGVEATTCMNVKVRFSEAIAEDLSEGAAGAINGKFTIDGKQLRYIAVPTQANIDAAKLANEIIVTDLKVGSWSGHDKEIANDNSRNMVYISIHKDFKLPSGTHGIQIANVGDWAGMTDKPQNIVTTQTFTFEVKPDTEAPTVDVKVQSPEQYLITFSKPVDTVTGKTVVDAVKIYTKEGYTASTKTALTQNANSLAGDYVITIVDEEGMAVGAHLATNAALTGVERLLVECNRDWSVRQQGQATEKDNYWKSGLNPFTFVISNVESQTGVAMAETAIDKNLQYDGTSPNIETAIDLYEKSAKKAYRGLTANTSGQFVFVEMTEPVQLVNSNGTAVSDPVTPNLQQDPTPAAYGATTGLPRQTYRFIFDANPDKVVVGSVAAGTLAEDDTTFIIAPNSQLDAGTWTLYIEQISDDHGNTSATINRKVTVPQTAPTTTDTKVAWAAFDNNAASGVTYDYLYVKFTKVMKAYTANGVDATTNYKFRGYDLPEGSQVFRGIDNVTDDWDGVTIRMPKTAWDGLAGNFSTNMAVASNFQSSGDEALSGPFQFELTNNAGGSAADKDGLTGANKFEAVYINAGTALVGGKIVIQSVAKDDDPAPNADGDIDTIVVTTDQNSTTVASDYIMVNGKKFITGGAAAATQTFVANGAVTTGSVGPEEIAGTTSNGLVIKAANGSIITNLGKVVDAAGPAITVIGCVYGSSTITVTFSEAIDDSTVIPGDFNLGGTGLTGGTTISSVNTGTTANDNIIVLNLSAAQTPAVGQTLTVALSAPGVISDRKNVVSTQTVADRKSVV